jgi:hypothetical protein
MFPMCDIKRCQTFVQGSSDLPALTHSRFKPTATSHTHTSRHVDVKPGPRNMSLALATDHIEFLMQNAEDSSEIVSAR